MEALRSIFFTKLSTLSQEKRRGCLFKQIGKYLIPLRCFALILFSLIIFLTGCGTTSHKPSLYEPPPVSDPTSAAHVIVARESKFTGAGMELYITLEGKKIAMLKSHQYTEFLLSAGRYTIGASFYAKTWLIGDSELGITGLWHFERDWRVCELTEKLIAGQEYKFLVSIERGDIKPRLKKVKSFPDNISLDPSKLVLPGTK
jgi:hypothetical protein